MVEHRYFLRGEIDIASVSGIEADLRTLIDADNDDVAIDCCGLVFIDSSGIACLVDAQRQLESLGRSLRVINADHLAERVLQLMGLTDTLHVNQGPTWALRHPADIATTLDVATIVARTWLDSPSDCQQRTRDSSGVPTSRAG